MPRKQGCYSALPLLDLDALIALLQDRGCCTPGGGNPAPALSLANGSLTLTIGGQSTSVNLRGGVPSGPAVDLADTPLGYWLPLT